MNVGELFIKLGFKVDNQESFSRAVKELGFGEQKAINLKHAIVGLGAAFTGLIWFSTTAATNLFKFHLATDLSTRKLQDWQFAGARAGVTAGEMADSIKRIQDAQVAIQFGEGNLAPWALLGIDPRQDPMKVLWEIHQRVKQSAGMGAAMARYLTTQLGLSETMFQFLRRDNLELGQLEEKFKITEEAQRKADLLNGRWAQMRLKLEQLAVQFGATFGPRLLELMERLTAKGGPLDKFVDWLSYLSSNTAEAEKSRARIVHLAEGIAILAASLTALSAAAKGVATIRAIMALFGIGAAATAAGGAGTAAAGAAPGFGTIVGPAAGGLATTLALPIVTLAGLFGIGKLLENSRRRAYESAKAGGGSEIDATYAADSVSILNALRDIFRAGAYPYTPYRPTGAAGAGQVTVNVNQTIRSTDPAAAGRESAAAIKQVLYGEASNYTNMNAMGATAH